MNTFVVRAISALLAIAIVIGLYFFFQLKGFVILAIVSIFLCQREVVRIFFPAKGVTVTQIVFLLCCFSVFLAASFLGETSAFWFAVGCLLFATFSLVLFSEEKKAQDLFEHLGKGLVGLLYIGFFPSFGTKILFLPHGGAWFSLLMALVFGGDTLAYLTGRLIGKHKILPQISPKKTVEGSIGGLVGSIIAGLVLRQWLPDVPLLSMIGVAICVGAVAQAGDFFESLIKRMADIKDSGTLMPGHGGVLDRLDGILFAAPLVWYAAVFFEGLI